MSDKMAMAAAVVQRRWSRVPAAALVLGTGLGRIARAISQEVVIPFADIPGFARTTALAHRGRLVCGTFAGVPLLVLDGRCHAYEGYSFDEVTLPIRVVHACHASTLIVTNACGGLNRHFAPGDLMVIDDHINLLGQFMCRQSTAICAAPRQPRLAESPYDPQLAELAMSISRRDNFVAHRGVYAAVTGPNYETRAEYSFLRLVGADAVGMSTVPEVQVAFQLGMRVVGLSTVTNVAHTDAPESVDARHVINAAQRAAPHVQQIVAGMIKSVQKGHGGSL